MQNVEPAKLLKIDTTNPLSMTAEIAEEWSEAHLSACPGRVRTENKYAMKAGLKHLSTVDRYDMEPPNDHCSQWVKIVFHPMFAVDGDMHYTYDPVTKDLSQMICSFVPGRRPMADWVLQYHKLVAPHIDAAILGKP